MIVVDGFNIPAFSGCISVLNAFYKVVRHGQFSIRCLDGERGILNGSEEFILGFEVNNIGLPQGGECHKKYGQDDEGLCYFIHGSHIS